MKYKTFKLDCTIEERAKKLDMTVNEYIFHLTRLNDEHTSAHSEETYKLVEILHRRVKQLEDGLTIALRALNDISEKLNGHRN
jgi:hypothetical protein